MDKILAASFSIQLSGLSAIMAISVMLSVPIFVRYRLRYAAFKSRVNSVKKRNTVVTQYEAPPNISPAFFGVIIDNRLSIQDLIATILDLHNRGNLKISYDDNQADYYLKSTDSPTQGLMPHQQYTYDLIAKTPTKTMWAKNFAAAAMVYHQQFSFVLQQDLQRAGYYYFNKNMDKLTASGYFMKTIMRSVFMGLIKPWNWPGILLSILFWPFGIAWLVFGLFYYNRLGLFKYKTKKWEEEWPEMSGYYNYLQVVEAEKRTHALETSEKSVKVEQHDPFLVAAQLQKHWKKIFLGVHELGSGGTEYSTYKRT